MSTNTIKEAVQALRFRLESAAARMEHEAAQYRRAMAELPEDPTNLPIVEASKILNRCGFAVVHGSQLESAIACVLTATGAEHETREESEELDKLLAYLREQWRAVC